MNLDVLKIHDKSFDENNPIDEIIGLHEEIRRAAETIKQKAIRIGELLVQQKQKLRHGEFGSWIKDNLPFCVRTAQIYMDIYRNKEFLKREIVSLSDAQKFLRLSRSKFKETKGEDEKRYYITISVYEEEKELLEDVLDMAKKMLNTESNSAAIMYIMYDWGISAIPESKTE